MQAIGRKNQYPDALNIQIVKYFSDGQVLVSPNAAINRKYDILNTYSYILFLKPNFCLTLEK